VSPHQQLQHGVHQTQVADRNLFAEKSSTSVCASKLCLSHAVKNIFVFYMFDVDGATSLYQISSHAFSYFQHTFFAILVAKRYKFSAL